MDKPTQWFSASRKPECPERGRVSIFIIVRSDHADCDCHCNMIGHWGSYDDDERRFPWKGRDYNSISPESIFAWCYFDGPEWPKPEEIQG